MLAPLGRAIGVSIATVYGGVSISRQIANVRHADVVVATPGRLIDLLERHALTLSDIQVTVLDEADHMADLGFMPAVTEILDQTPADGQRMFFSATLDRGVGKLVTSYISDPALHAVTSSTDSGPAEHRVLVLSAQDKVTIAAEIASRPGRTLFFVRTKHGADRLVKQLSRAGVEAAAIHGDRNQNQRQRALDAFAAGHPRVLVATDVAARGIHVDDVDLVVQFDPPNDHKDYLHRSGRTARAGASGMVIALAERAQVRELQKMHAAAGVTAASDEVAAGDHVVREIAASGTPVPPAPPVPDRLALERKTTRGPARRRGHGQRSASDQRGGGSAGSGSRAGSGRAPLIAAGGREDTARGTARGTTRGTVGGTTRGTVGGGTRGTAQPGRRSQSGHQPHQPHQARKTGTPRSRPERWPGWGPHTTWMPRSCSWSTRPLGVSRSWTGSARSFGVTPGARALPTGSRDPCYPARGSVRSGHTAWLPSSCSPGDMAGATMQYDHGTGGAMGAEAAPASPVPPRRASKLSGGGQLTASSS